MQNMVGMKISVLKSDWGALYAHEKGWQRFIKIPQITYIPLGFGLNCVGLQHYFPKISLGSTGWSKKNAPKSRFDLTDAEEM